MFYNFIQWLKSLTSNKPTVVSNSQSVDQIDPIRIAGDTVDPTTTSPVTSYTFGDLASSVKPIEPATVVVPAEPTMLGDAANYTLPSVDDAKVVATTAPKHKPRARKSTTGTTGAAGKGTEKKTPSKPRTRTE